MQRAQFKREGDTEVYLKEEGSVLEGGKSRDLPGDIYLFIFSKRNFALLCLDVQGAAEWESSWFTIGILWHALSFCSTHIRTAPLTNTQPSFGIAHYESQNVSQTAIQPQCRVEQDL